MTMEKTPAANWREDGAKDPFGNQYNCERSELAMGYMTDDELANEIFLYDHRNGLASMPRLTAAKERIRWLSRKLVSAEKELREFKEKGLSPADKLKVSMYIGDIQTAFDENDNFTVGEKLHDGEFNDLISVFL